MDTSQNNIGFFPQMPICNKHSAIELNSDFTLPDYQPEIRRLLSTRAIILPHSEYIGNGNAEISGEINYKITYLGADNELYSVTLSDKYKCNAPLNFNSHSVNNDDTLIIPSCKTESVSARVLGPRKLNVRSKLDCQILAFSPSIYTPNLVGAHNKSSIENKISHTNCINIKKSANESLILNDFVSFDTQTDNIRIIDCSASVTFSECLALSDKISAKGDATLKILYCNDGESAHPICITKKIPFSHELSCMGVNSLFECIPHGVCFDEHLDFKENGVTIDCTLSICATAQRNENVQYIADAYSTEKVCETSTSELSVLNFSRCALGNLTQNDVFILGNINLSRDAKIIDINGKSNINEFECENGKLIFKGTNDYQLIYFLDGEYSSILLNAPVKYELDGRSLSNSIKAFQWQALSSVSSVRARHDGERLFVDCELNIGLTLNYENTIQILDEMIFGEYLKKADSEILLCYPDKFSTVWSVAKQYGVSPKNLRSKNSISEVEEQIKKRYLII